jgi:hypothetical protein
MRIMKMHMLDVPKSGRSGDVVFFMIRNRQRERAYVIPKTIRKPRDAGQGSLMPISSPTRLASRPSLRSIRTRNASVPDAFMYQLCGWVDSSQARNAD